MDLSSLEIFRAVAHEASVTRAAQRLQRAQSNVTTRIRQLEEDLGVELFLRDGKRMSLTERGSEFLAYAEQLLALADEARQSMHPAEPGGRLRLGSMESTAASRLPALLASYHKACPRVALEVSTGTSRALFDGVRARRLDCALVAAGPGWAGEHEGSGLRGAPLLREELRMIQPAAHP
ncbi:LysR family transcriptional regulator, partial [Pseudomonas aeruginosa]|nr:LysR family transcriptional regulator [Pseudomonas aeruginosa]